MRIRTVLPSVAVLATALLLLACSDASTPGEPAEEATEAPAEEAAADDAPAAEEEHDDAEVAGLADRARAIFGALPATAEIEANPSTEARVALGKALYVDKRLSKNHDIACNSCHGLDNFGVDNEQFSPGHQGLLGGRNSPSSFNAALHVAQFWDGRSPDVEDQAKGPVLNPIEMAMPDSGSVDTVLKSIPGYAPMFEAAFPGDDDPVNFDNMALAIAAFERLLITPGRFDAFMGGELDALTAQEQSGLATFMGAGCITCHNGPAVGGRSFQKIGAVNPYAGPDPGRMAVTGEASDRQVFKVPSLRNVAKTAPYFHDGSIKTLDEAVRQMAHLQLGKQLTDEAVADILAFLEALTGEVDPALVAMPELPESGPDTPAPDPS